MLFAAQVEHGDAVRPVELQVAVVVQRAGRLQGAVAAYADQLDAVVGRGRDEGVHRSAHLKGGDPGGAAEL